MDILVLIHEPGFELLTPTEGKDGSAGGYIL